MLGPHFVMHDMGEWFFWQNVLSSDLDTETPGTSHGPGLLIALSGAVPTWLPRQIHNDGRAHTMVVQCLAWPAQIRLDATVLQKFLAADPK